MQRRVATVVPVDRLAPLALYPGKSFCVFGMLILLIFSRRRRGDGFEALPAFTAVAGTLLHGIAFDAETRRLEARLLADDGLSVH